MTGWHSRDPSQTLSDQTPEPVGLAGTIGTSGDTARADHVHRLGRLTSFEMESPDGTVWTVTMSDLGAFVTDEVNIRVTTGGDTRVTTSGDVRVPAEV